MLFRLANIVTITLSMFLGCLRRFCFGDCVIVVTNPPLLPFAVLIASLLRGGKCCLLVHDVYPEVLVATGIAKHNSLVARSIGWLTRQLYKRMERVIVLGRDMHALVKEKFKIIDQHMHIIPNWADVDFIKPCGDRNYSLLAQLGLSDKFNIQYSGNIGRTHGIEHLVTCAEQLERDSAIHFLFIGFGGKKAWLKRAVEDRGLKNVSVLDYRPRSDLPNSLNACDIAIISLAKGMTGVSVPSRMYNVMAAGKPIIAVADENSEIALVVREEDIGWVVSPGDIGGLRNVILDAKTNPNLLMQMGQRARQVAETKYSVDLAIQAYAEMLASIREDAG